MQETKIIVTGDYIDEKTGLRFIEDIRGNLHFCPMLTMSGMSHQIHVELPDITIPPITFPSGNISCNCNPNVIVTVDLASEKDKEIFDLLSENAWLWGLIEQAIKDKKEKNCNYAMTKLEQAVKDGMP